MCTVDGLLFDGELTVSALLDGCGEGSACTLLRLVREGGDLQPLTDGDDVVGAGCGDVCGPSGQGWRIPDEFCADEGAVDQDRFRALLGNRLQGAVQARSWAASSPISSSRQRRTVDSDTLFPPAMSARRWSWRVRPRLTSGTSLSAVSLDPSPHGPNDGRSWGVGPRILNPVPDGVPGTFPPTPHGRESPTISVRPITPHRIPSH